MTTTPAPTTFADFSLSPELTRALTELGFETPTEIQRLGIPILMHGPKDFLGLATTGTGKTAAFAIPLLETMPTDAKGVHSIILCPTRELAQQVTEQIRLLGRYKKVKIAAIYGGADYRDQFAAIQAGAGIVVGTPGRVIDHLERGSLDFKGVRTVILDEADEMISMGFREEIESILSKIDPGTQHQTWLFSATMEAEVRKIADRFLRDPAKVQVRQETGVSATVSQYFFQVYEEEKPEVVERLIDSIDDFYGLIFCQTKTLVVKLSDHLRARGYPADCLHGDMDQKARERAMRAFKARERTIMVCTDVASRGIDVKDLTHVINYSLPREMDLYVHRIGRTARGGKEGVAFNLVTPSHMGLVGRIEKVTRSRMTRAAVPDDASLVAAKLARRLAAFREGLDPQAVAMVKESFAKTGWQEALAGLDAAEIAARFLVHALRTPAPVAAPTAPVEEPRRPARAYGPRGDDRPRPYRPRDGDGPRRPYRSRDGEGPTRPYQPTDDQGGPPRRGGYGNGPRPYGRDAREGSRTGKKPYAAKKSAPAGKEGPSKRTFTPAYGKPKKDGFKRKPWKDKKPNG